MRLVPQAAEGLCEAFPFCTFYRDPTNLKQSRCYNNCNRYSAANMGTKEKAVEEDF